MLTTKRKPATVGEILVEEFMQPMGLTQAALAEAMGVQRKHVNELCNSRRTVTAATALILARVFGNSPDFWLNVQRRSDLWEAMNSPSERERIERAKPLVPRRDLCHREGPDLCHREGEVAGRSQFCSKWRREWDTKPPNSTITVKYLRKRSFPYLRVYPQEGCWLHQHIHTIT